MNEFMIGCNYWDSASGTDMWKNWQPEIVEKDLSALENCGVEYLRVFPLWRDFQPVRKLYTVKNTMKEYVLGENEESTEGNPHFLSHTMIEHFKAFANMAKNHNMKLIVSIVTGWMSGRLFVPPAIEGKNPLTDPEALMLTDKFITGLIKEVKDIDNIVMWDLGNECNCMAEVASRNEAYTWAAFVKNAIRGADATRPISSGMHSLYADESSLWHIEDQGHLCDFMTTHPYPSPTVNADIEPLNKMRTTIVPTAQSEFYSGIAEKPCIIQEQGTFCNAVGNRQAASEFMRANLFSAWANNLSGYFWWCGVDHVELRNPPYSWSMIERELGLVEVDSQPKPVGREMKRFAEIVKTLPAITPKQVDALCVLPEGGRLQKAISSCILAKQAGFNIKITTTASETADAYIVPCMNFWNGMDIRILDKIYDRVENHGASLLFTFDGGATTELERITGLTSMGLRQPLGTHTAKFDFGEINYTARREILLESVGAEVLAENEEGNIVLSKNKFGKGYVYFLNMPLEALAYERPEGFNPEITEPYYKVYELFGQKLIDNYTVNSPNPYIGVTQSKIDGNTYIVTAINYSDKPQDPHLIIKDGVSIEPLYGDTKLINKCDALILKVSGKC